MIRINEIVDLTEKCRAAADIGCDHGYISKRIIETNKACKVYATDISRDSLSKTEQLIKYFGFEDRIIPVAGDGILPVECFFPEVIVIAGMGGHLIARIIENSIDTCKKAKQLVLCPHTHEKELRYFLRDNGFLIYKEKIVFEDGKYYQLMTARKGDMCIFDDISAEIGVAMIRNKEYINFLEHKQNSYINISKNIIKNGGDEKKAAEYEKHAEIIGEIKNACIKKTN